jgi:hypothetical protein
MREHLIHRETAKQPRHSFGRRSSGWCRCGSSAFGANRTRRDGGNDVNGPFSDLPHRRHLRLSAINFWLPMTRATAWRSKSGDEELFTRLAG